MALTHELDNIRLGNILIKYTDKWRGNYYLKDDLTFTVDRSLAARFYFLKSGDTTILNGDRISVNLGNRTLSITESNQIRLVDREHVNRSIYSFLITNGIDNTDPITFETAIYLISNRDRRTALKYEWGMELISPSDGSNNAMNYKPQSSPTLVNEDYGSNYPITSFQFLLERADGPITNMFTTARVSPAVKEPFLDGYKGALMIFLLMVILILSIIASK